MANEPFTMEMSGPVSSGGIRDLGGPKVGGHKPPRWFEEYGMDLGVPKDTEVFAAFSGRITDWKKHNPKNDTATSYGAMLWVRSNDDKMGAYYTHFTAHPDLKVGQHIEKGLPLGKIMRDHLHMAICEIINGKNIGRDLHSHFLKLNSPEKPLTVTFHQESKKPPTVSASPPGFKPEIKWVQGWWKVWDGNTYYYYFDTNGVVKYTKTRPFDTSSPLLRADNTGSFTYDGTLRQLVVTWSQLVDVEQACTETFSNITDKEVKLMNATSNLYSPLVATRM